MKSWHQQKGMTLLEILLVLAVASSLILFGVRQYQQYRQQQDFESLLVRVDELFQAGAAYYRANCPKIAKEQGHFEAQTVSKLQEEGFLSARSYSNPLASNYLVEFPRQTAIPRYIYVCDSTNGCQPEPLSSNSMGKNVVLTQIQVAVKFVNASAALMASYKVLLGADCISESYSGKDAGVKACGGSVSQGDYLVWTRSPSLAAVKSNSNLWPSLHTVTDFKLQYNHDLMYEKINPNNYGKYDCGG